MALVNTSNLLFFGLVCLCAILGRELFYFKTKQNDVFLNFRGQDTRYGIISHLDDALSRRNIKTFIDSVLPRGEELASLLKEIEASRVAVVVFSEDYASSSWCLDELVRITECRGILGMKVLPIFYRINSSEVSNQNGSFQAAFDRHEKDFKDRLHIVQRWRAALMEVSSLDGVDSRQFGREPDLVKEAVDKVARLLRVSRSEEETTAWRVFPLICIFFPVVFLLSYKELWLHLFAGDFTSSVDATASIFLFVFLGFLIRDHWVYLGTLDSYYDVLPFGIFRSNPRSASEINVVIVISIVVVLIGTIGTLWSKYIGSRGQVEADQFNNNGSNAQDDDEDSAENSSLE